MLREYRVAMQSNHFDISEGDVVTFYTVDELCSIHGVELYDDLVDVLKDAIPEMISRLIWLEVTGNIQATVDQVVRLDKGDIREGRKPSFVIKVKEDDGYYFWYDDVIKKITRKDEF